MFVLSPALAFADEAPLQELDLAENPYLQEPLELQISAAGGWYAPGAPGGSISAELGLWRGTQVGIARSEAATELEAGVLLARTERGIRAAAIGEVALEDDEACCGLALGFVAAAPLGPLVLAGGLGAEREAQTIVPSGTAATILPIGPLAPFLEGMWAPGLLSGALGLRWHPAEPFEIGAAGRLGGGPEGLDWGATVLFVAEMALRSGDEEP